ncbi:hypothetical protein DICPUDRAFT_91744 [Dictyostelium purpureum]|uniref:SHSP domain-containing protein n=1 Tax=Dictyostelium purpureum TaxID=5786 RepID=F0ZGN4_DICPU|nr:uncharacterized protein DICPUDRAFT_91744 [Dictyostelium purpureum]EGC36917.1 hypothetical protein DICPUDRAFT_91744 [Dictyostelium purpureum]|eukprot:XP_003286560.1 hypothetical protein DICPUDRAFT_91744 [Dictyostelium purpureum]
MATIFDILLNQHLNNNNNNNKYHCTKSSPQTTQDQQQQQQETKVERIDFLPELDVVETKESLIIETELAGVSKDDIQIEIKDSKLYIQGEKKRSTHKDDKSNLTSVQTVNTTKDNEPSIEEYEDTATTLQSSDKQTKSELKDAKESKKQVKKYISERSYGYFKRYLDLTRVLYTLDLSTIKTQYNNGLLTITINKKQDYSNTIKIHL